MDDGDETAMQAGEDREAGPGVGSTGSRRLYLTAAARTSQLFLLPDTRFCFVRYWMIVSHWEPPKGSLENYRLRFA